MITKEDYKNLLEFFEEKGVPDNLKVFNEKVKLIYKQLELSEKFQEEVGVINDDLRKLIDQSE